MAKPNAPKEIKPKEGEIEKDKSKENKGAPSGLIINIITTVLICSVFLLGNYFMQDSLLSKKLPSDAAATEGDAAAADGEDAGADAEAERGIIVDLGDFTMNLSDADARRYLKASVALELTKTETDNAPAEKAEGHGEGAAPAASPLEAEMAQYKPAIRDAIISALSSKTSAELSTTAGKELAKEEISDSVDSIFGGEREVIRVSFGQFIMQ